MFSTTTRRSSHPAQDALYEPNACRSSDHHPVIVGLNLAPEDTTLEITGTFYDSNGTFS